MQGKIIIKEKIVTNKWNSYNKNYYIDKGYNFTKMGDTFEVNIEDLIKGSAIKVTAICPICDKEHKKQYRNIIEKGNTNCINCNKKINREKLFCEKCNKNDYEGPRRKLDDKMFCGKCYRDEKIIEKHGKLIKTVYEKNDIEILSDYAEVILRNKNGEEVARAKIDIEDIEKVKDIKWRYYTGYAYGVTPENGSLKMHRYIMNCDDEHEVDHIYHDTLDNRKKYLKIVKHRDNCLNRRLNINNINFKIMNVYNSSTINGTGFRTVIFASGCPHGCEDCFNKETWNINNGKDYSLKQLLKLINNNDEDVTFSGGDPFVQWYEFKELAKEIKKHNKNIWCYTGYKFEDIVKDNEKRLLLEYIDVLVDGPFKKDLRDEDLLFRGSSNQRLIDVKNSLKINKIVLWEEE